MQDTIQYHATQVQNYDEELARTNAIISRMEIELSVATSAQDSLLDQKQDNVCPFTERVVSTDVEGLAGVEGDD